MTPQPEVDGLAAEVAARVLSRSADPALDAAVRHLAGVCGRELEAVVFFGSRRTGASRANAHSAYDAFVVVREYRGFYERLRSAGLTGKRPRLMALVSRWLPPTQYSLLFPEQGVHLKAAVIRLDTYRRETSPRRRDHFCTGRLFQPSRVLYVAGPEARDAVVDGLVAAHRATWTWARPWLPVAFDSEAYGLTALRVSMSWEIRPEPRGRADALWAAQREEQGPVFGVLLEELREAGELRAVGEGLFAPSRPPGRLRRLELDLYFRRSMLRATARWLKHVVTFEGWLDYILRKANRHGGEPVELSERERRWPWVFLWGRLFRYLRTKDEKGRPS